MLTPTIHLNPNTQTIGILSDSHGYLDARVINALKKVDVILHAGDIMDNGVLQQLHTINSNLYCVTGNNDTESVWQKKHKDIVNRLPESLILQLGNSKIGLVHGHQYGLHQPDYKQLRNLFNGCRLIIYGHTHQQIVNTQNTPWIVNPGASGKIRTRGGASCLILHCESDNWHIQTIKFIDCQLAA